jgi:hypothetical protein
MDLFLFIVYVAAASIVLRGALALRDYFDPIWLGLRIRSKEKNEIRLKSNTNGKARVTASTVDTLDLP